MRQSSWLSWPLLWFGLVENIFSCFISFKQKRYDPVELLGIMCTIKEKSSTGVNEELDQKVTAWNWAGHSFSLREKPEDDISWVTFSFVDTRTKTDRSRASIYGSMKIQMSPGWNFSERHQACNYETLALRTCNKIRVSLFTHLNPSILNSQNISLSECQINI